MKKLSLIIAAAALLTAARPAFAWRETGHFTVCELAFRALDLRARKAVLELLPGQDFAQSCTWPDMVRKTAKWKHTYPWHFINLEDGQSYPQTIERAGDVVQALVKNEDILRDPSASPEDRAAALKFIAHFAGDIHQPLHTGRKSDLGGNNVKVSWFGAKEYLYEEILEGETVRKLEPFNLHKVWDLHLVERFIEERRLEDGTPTKHRAYADAVSAEHPGPAEDSATFLDWALESLSHRREVYDIGDGALGEAFYRRNIQLANRRMAQGGRRLGALLNRIFSGAPLSPRELAMRETLRRALGQTR